MRERNAATELKELDAVINAVAHPTRRRILMVILMRGGEMGSGEIADRFHCAWPTTVRHLRVLETSGLLTQRKVGRTSLYNINRNKIDVLKEWIAWFYEP